MGSDCKRTEMQHQERLNDDSHSRDNGHPGQFRLRQGLVEPYRCRGARRGERLYINALDLP